ncbi:hypothetical protein TNCV_2676491 [Trichonephila clavipes]|nr:hypothetical protein TNCV_2676491 [Trichonephila clavipes]
MLTKIAESIHPLLVPKMDNLNSTKFRSRTKHKSGVSAATYPSIFKRSYSEGIAVSYLDDLNHSAKNEQEGLEKLITGVPRGNGQVERIREETLIPVLTKRPSIDDSTK